METEITDIGKVAITPQKDYQNERTYEWLDVVTYDGAGYMCIAEDGCTGIVPTNTDYWQLLADKGHFTEEDKEEFKKAVVEESKTEINEHTGNKKTELNNYTTELEKSLENELDTYKAEKESQMDLYKATLETEMANKKDSLIEEIETAQNGFDTNAEEKTNTFNSNVETKTTEFNNNSNTKTEEFNNNSTEKINAFNSNAEEKIADYDAHAETLTNRIAELEAETEDLYNALPIEEASGTELCIEDAKPCRIMNTEIGGMYKQETTTGANLLDTSDMLFNNGTLEQNGLTAKINTDGSIVINGTATANTYFKKSIKNILEDGNYYFYNFNNVTQSNSTYYMLIQGNKSTGYGSTDYYNARGYQTDNFIKDIITYDRNFDCTFVFINGFVANNLILYPEISKTKQTVFESYTGGNPSPNPDYPQKIEQVESVKLNINNKNLLNPIFTVGSNCTIENQTITSTVLLAQTLQFIRFGFPKIKLKKGIKYYISFRAKKINTNYAGGFNQIQLFTADNKKFITFSAIANPNLNANYQIYNFVSANITEEQALLDYVKILIQRKNIAEDLVFAITDVMVTKENTEYTAYQNQAINIDLKGNKLCAISSTIKGKLLIDRSGNVVLQKNVNKYIFTGDENFIINSTTDSYNEFTCVIPNLYSKKYFETKSNKFLYNLDNRISISDTGAFYIRTPIKLQIDTIDKFRAIIKDTEVYYVLATPEIIDLGQLTELLKTFEGINNIWAETNLGNTKIEIEYVQDVKKLLEKQAEQQNARLDNIEALLSTTETSALLLDNMQTDLEKEVK